MLLKLFHDGIGDSHVLEHAFQLRCELTTALSLKIEHGYENHKKYQLLDHKY